MVKSRSERFIQQRQAAPIVSSSMATSVSQFRRDSLQNELDSGAFREEGSGYQIPEHLASTAAGNVVGSTSIFKRGSASLGVGGSGSDFRGSGGTMRQVPEIYSPLWLTSNLNLPRDRATINAWSRAYYALNPIVRNAISLHATYPISRLSIKCHDKKVEQFFEDMNEEIDLMNKCLQVAQEYWLLGEAVIYGQLDEGSGKWGKLLIQNPDYVVIKHSVIAGEPVISLRPDENLKRIITSNRPSDVQQRKMLDPAIVQHIKRGENIPLDNFYTSHLANKINPYDIRGTGLVTCCFRQLMLFDILRESKFHQAYNLINPLTMVKIGNEKYKPSPADLEAFREIWEAGQYDRDFKIFTHEAVDVTRVGANSAIIDISGDITQILKEMYIGLMVPQVLMDGGSEVTYANGSVSLDVLRQRYMYFRNIMGYWLRRKIFAPISKINEFYERREGKKFLIVPEVEWNHMSLFDTGDYIQAVSSLVSGEKKEIATQTLHRTLGLDYIDERAKMKEEAIQDAIYRKELESLEQMSLNDLRALKPDGEIEEIIPSPVPGESPHEEGEVEEEEGLEGLPGVMPGPMPGGGGGPELGEMAGGEGGGPEAPPIGGIPGGEGAAGP
jgi:hypothetical protein